MKKSVFFCFTFMLLFSGSAQDFTSYIVGNSNDVITAPAGGICLMGGAAEDDNAMTWFLNRVDGGDVLVLRTSGSDGYNNYMYNSLGITLNSVETIVFNNANASTDPYVLNKVANAEAIWFAGGDQSEYLAYWQGTALDSTIRSNIQSKNIVIGGTSAGMAIQGGVIFSADNGTITSSEALSNPYDSKLVLNNSPFMAHSILANVITDTHYDNPDRKGRHVAFLSRAVEDYGGRYFGIACDEYTAVCIDENGIASVYGDYPNYDDFAYFISVNCEIFNNAPIPHGSPMLHWNQSNAALKVYKIGGNSTGSNSFDLNTWESGTGGNWENWWVDMGVLSESASVAPDCSSTGVETSKAINNLVYPNPSSGRINFTSDGEKSIKIYNVIGELVYSIIGLTENNLTLDLPSGIYQISLVEEAGVYSQKLIIE